MLEMKQRADEIKAGGTPSALKHKKWMVNNPRYSTALMKPIDDYKEQQELEALIKEFSIKFQLTSGDESSDDESEEEEEEVRLKSCFCLLYSNNHSCLGSNQET